MKNIISIIFAAVTISMTVISCVYYPMGLSQEEWNSLSPEKKVEFKLQQDALDEARRQQRLREQLEQQRLALQQQESIRQRYVQASFGDIVTVTIQSGTFEFAGKWYEFEPVIFDLIRGENKTVELVNTKRQNSLSISMPVSFSEDGNRILFYDDNFGNPASIINDGSWKTGHRYGPLDLNSGSKHTGVRGAIVQVRFKLIPVPTKKIIIERR